MTLHKPTCAGPFGCPLCTGYVVGRAVDRARADIKIASGWSLADIGHLVIILACALACAIVGGAL